MGTITACLATNLRNLRKQKHWTQTELAEAAGVSLVFIQGIEAERKWVSPATAKSLAKALGVAEAKLFENCFDRKPAGKTIKRAMLKVDHIPDDVYFALATTCRDEKWKWEAVRWLITGFERSRAW